MSISRENGGRLKVYHPSPLTSYIMFEQLPTVPTSEELLNKSFRRASRATDDESMVQNAGNILSDNLSNLIKKFPSFENLPPFYREMADIIAGWIRSASACLAWAGLPGR